MKVLINFSPLKVGGGKNVAMNFLHSFTSINLVDTELFFFVAKDSEPHLFLKNIRYPDYFVVPRHPIARILFEAFQSSAILTNNRIDIIYSYFGVGVFPKKIPQVSGSADSNLYFPEINFWSDFSGLGRLKKWVIDLYRIWGVKRSSAVVFENSALEKRAQELFNLKLTKVVKPSINFKFESKRFMLPIGIDNTIPKGLFLCGWHPNKNYMVIPDIASKLKQRGLKFNFLITAPLDNSLRHKQFNEQILKMDVEDMVTVIGQVKKNELQSLYEQIDYVFLLSRLESFSNNIIEAWYFKKLLIITDAIWARSICGDAALYVDRDSAPNIADTIISIVSNEGLKSETINNGASKIKEYPTIEERIEQEMEFLKYVQKSN